VQQSYFSPSRFWPGDILAGTAYGFVAFFSVFIFMFKGRTATFAGLANRLTSLVAGTAATLLFAVLFQGNFPMPEDWLSLVFIFIAVAFMSRAEAKRAAELKKENEAYRETGALNGGSGNR
jgi:drug/metabolite transporter (DMT)-like permease